MGSESPEQNSREQELGPDTGGSKSAPHEDTTTISLQMRALPQPCWRPDLRPPAASTGKATPSEVFCHSGLSGLHTVPTARPERRVAYVKGWWREHVFGKTGDAHIAIGHMAVSGTIQQ